MSRKKYPYYLQSIWNLIAEFKPRSQILRVFLHLPYPSDQNIELIRNGIQFKIRGAMDIWTIKETFIDQFYEKYGSQISDGWSVIDIGSGIGDFSIYATVGYPGNTVYAFEPTPESYNLLLYNIKINHISNIKTYPAAVWSSTQDLVMDTTQIEPGQFLSRPLNGAKTSDDDLIVQGLSLEDVFERSGIARCNLLKIDSEGAEYSILFNTPGKILNQIERIIMEYHDLEAGYTHQDLVSFLTQNGFGVHTYPNYVHSHIGYLFAWR